MKQIYVNLQRMAWVYAMTVMLAALSPSLALAQSQADFEPGIVRIKVTEELAQRLETSPQSRNANDVLLTGIQSIDVANIRYNATEVKRVFRPAGKFEAKHRRYGLHLWYEIQIDKSASLPEVIASYLSIDDIVKAEPSYKKAIIGSDRADFGPVRVKEKEIKAGPLTGAANDPMLGNQWHYNNTGQQGGTPGSDIKLFQAWAIETGSPSVVIAVTDGGAQVNHPDLAANMWVNTGEIAGNNIDDDNNGFVDDVNGYGFGDDTGTIAPDDHGTHTSGTIAAVTNNGVGVAGVAGGTGTGDGARIMTLATFGGTANGGFAESYIYGADNGAVISQNSWGYTNPGVFEQAVLDGIDYFIAEAGKDEDGNQIGPMRGGIVIFAAGNDDLDAQWYPGFYSPTLAVGALTNQDKKAWYSNFGTWVDMSAPGGETFFANDPHGVLSTVAGNQYAFFQGTSMACPHVSGVAALIISKFGGDGFTPEMLRGRLTTLVDDVDAADPDFAGLLGTGRLNAFKALQSDDGDAPDEITDLAASDAEITSVTLTWTSPADPGNGSASAYDIRYATFPITNANFTTATAVASPPAPLVAGSAESLTIPGLTAGTVYYFAIRSADFFGNYSDISNVVEQATNFPPVITVSPASITETLQTASTSVQFVQITNSGAGELNYQFATPPANAFATVSPTSGTLDAGLNILIAVTIDANNRLPGTYDQNLVLNSNDPATPTVTIPVTLTVISNGQPIASVDPTALDFGGVFETSSATRTVTVHNAGAETLNITSVSSSNGNFTTNFSSPIAVAAFADAVISVTFTPSGLGVSTGTLSIATNDPSNPSLSVSLEGEGVPAPDVQVNPSSLTATLTTGATQTQTLTVSNTGGSDLEYSVEVTGTAAATTIADVATITIPVGSVVQSAQAAQKNSGVSTYSNQVTLRSVGQSAAISNVLILSPDTDVTDIEEMLDGFADIEADVFPRASLPSITLADLSGYDIVFTTNNTQWLQGGGVQPAVIGDLLADYIDAGGKVISNQFNYSYDAWKLEGRFINEQYGPFTASTTDANITVDLGTILAPAHPVMTGVSTLSYSGFVQNVGLAPGATALAEWDNGELFVAANPNVVALNLLPSLGNAGPLQWSGDLPLLYQNAVHFLSGPGFVEVNPTEGVIAAGTSVNLSVTFDATGLDSATYEALINISTNVPGQAVVVVPATLHVLGAEFTVDPESLHEDLEKNQTSTQTITLRNNGTANRTYTIDVEGVGTAVSASVAIENISMTRAMEQASAPPDPSEKIARNNAGLPDADLTGESSVIMSGMQTMMRSSAVQESTGAEQAASSQYATDFSSFAAGNINGQQGWSGQFGNWRVESFNPYSPTKHFRGLSDGFGQSLAFSPTMPIGVEEKSTTSMKLNVAGTGVTWQVIPQSPAAALVNTRIQFAPNGVVSALVKNSAGVGVFQPFGTTPSGYFNLTIEVDRDSAYFNVYFDETKVFTGQGFTGSVQQVVILSLMQVAGPTFDMDDFRIIDGEKTAGVSWLTVSPISGNIPAGSAVTLNVTFNSNNLDFGTYNANINIKAGDKKLTVPASLRVFGDPQIDVDPTVISATVDYREDTVRHFNIENTGGNPLNYSLQVVGAGTSQAQLIAMKEQQSAQLSDDATREKASRDARDSRVILQPLSAIKMLTGVTILDENFEDASFPPSGWQVIDNEGTGLIWDFETAHGEGNYSGTGHAATVSSDAAGSVEFDTELITPSISTAGFKDIAIQYNANYQNFANLDFLDLDIQVDGGAWTNVLSWNEDHGALFGAGVSVTVELASYIGDGSSFKLRWHYYDPNSGDFDWYAQIDDLVVYGNARAWLTVSPASGTIPVQGDVDIEAHFDASDIEAGNYVAGILVSSNAEEDPLVGVVAQLTVRGPAVMTVTPTSLHQELLKGEVEEATQTLTISNSGQSSLKFAFGNTPIPNAASAPAQERRVTTRRTTSSSETVDFADARAMRSDAPSQSSVSLYATSFEEFAPGDINGQLGWAGQFGNWDIEADNAYEGLQHIHSISDGLGATRAFSPVVAIGTDPISSTTARVYGGAGVTWQIVPQSPTAGFVNTRLQINPNRTMSALVNSATPGFVVIPGVTLPEGYVELRIDVERATSVFTVFIDGEEVFSGAGFAGSIEQVVLFSGMEVQGPAWDVDNLAIYDGSAVAPWLTFNPKSGIVPPGGSTTITVNFNATELEVGLYTDTLTISSNDPANASVDVPVSLNVLFNTPPALAPIPALSVTETTTANVTFTATDIDNEPVTVALHSAPAFVTSLSSASGSATYKVAPALGDAGTYELLVSATDARGKSDTAIFTLTVVPYGVQNFTLFNTRTNQPVATFTDHIDIDIAYADFSKLTVIANTSPAAVGSVKFTIDTRHINTDNNSPYALSNNTIKGLALNRDHTLVATSYTKKDAKGVAAQSMTATIHFVNSASVTDFDVVRINGSKLSDLVDGSVIDISNHNYRLVNVKANTAGNNTIKSVVFTLNGSTFRIDNLAPYVLGGLGSLLDLPIPPVPGSYTLTATPYSDIYGLGVAGQPLTVSFTVVNGTMTAARSSEEDAARSITPEEDAISVEEAKDRINLYPIPAREVLNVEVVEKTETQIGFYIVNAQGQSLFRDGGSSDKFRKYSVDLQRLGLRPGFYFVQVVYPDGRREVRKFIQE